MKSSKLAHAFFFGGLAAIIIGGGLAYRPLGFFIGGCIGVWIAFLIAAEAPK